MNAEHVKIRGKLFLYRQKAPFVESGMSIKGALEFDQAEDKLRCHECGEWFCHLGSHVAQTHGMPARDYKRKHGLQIATALIGEGVREKKVRNHSGADPRAVGMRTRLKKGSKLAKFRQGVQQMELRNDAKTCHAQILEKVQRLARSLGRTPTVMEATEHGISIRSAELAFQMKWRDVLILAGLKPNASFKRIRPRRRMDPAVLLDILRNFVAINGRVPGRSDRRRGLVPDYDPYYLAFGSMRAAYEAAGIRVVRRGNAFLAA